MEISALKYPKKSHRKSVFLPNESEQLAELIGAEFGDGGINNAWQINITLNSILDVRYSVFLAQLITKLFGCAPKVWERKGHRLLVTTSSTSIVDFLVSKGCVRGNKIAQEFDVPGWISHNPVYSKAFVRGMVDTDGCLYIHHHKVSGKLYHNLGLCFTSYSRPLIQSVAKIFADNGIKPHLSDDRRRIYLYKSNSVVQYLKIFGSSNPRITRKFSEWRGRIVVTLPPLGKRLGS
jgi:intein/homing endonuclease